MATNTVALPAVAGFVRQLAHDIRNPLNGLDLEAALLAELVPDSEVTESVQRMRGQIRALAAQLKALSRVFSGNEARRAPVAAQVLFLFWQEHARALGLDSIAWGDPLGEEEIDVDLASVCDVLKELLTNAKEFTGAAGLAAMAESRGGRVEFRLVEPKSEVIDARSWGKQPFVSTKRGGYGLGLWQAERIIEANGGEIKRAVAAGGALVTKVSFPLVTSLSVIPA